MAKTLGPQRNSAKENSPVHTGIPRHDGDPRSQHRCAVRAIITAAWMLLPVSSTLGGPEAGALRFHIEDGGRPRAFEVALDELDISDQTGVRKALDIPVQPDLKSLRERAAEHPDAKGAPARIVLYERGVARDEFTRRIVTPRVLLQVAPGTDLKALAKEVGATIEPSPVADPKFAVVSLPGIAKSLEAAETLRTQPGVLSADPMLARQHQRMLVPTDPLFKQQWHLFNSGANGAKAGIDLNVTNAWNSVHGTNIFIGIVDDSLQVTHPDLKTDTAIDYDWNDGDSDPSPNPMTDYHGTACGGLAAARGNNGRGVAGVAFDATLVGLRLIAGPISDYEEALCFSHSNQVIHIKSNSWGPGGPAGSLEGPGPLGAAALEEAALAGRGGRGTIFIFAGGNSRVAKSDANYNAYANSIYTLSVGAINDLGGQASYSEPGACLNVCTPSSSNGRQGIVTTDLVGNSGYNTSSSSGELSDRDYTKTFGGTSASTPMLAGVVALLLQANPQLGWRDVQEILMATARNNLPQDSDWVTNAAGFHFNHKYGAGLVNATAAVDAARPWTLLPTQRHVALSLNDLTVPIPDNDPNGAEVELDLSFSHLRIEHVTLTATISHPFRGDLAIMLISPTGVPSRLAEAHAHSGVNYDAWTMMTVHDWGELSTGVWKVRVADLIASNVGAITDLRLDIYGTSAGQATPFLTPAGATLTDSPAGNGNGDPEPGETIQDSVRLKNLGDGNANEVVSTITTSSPGITLLTANATYPAINSEATAEPAQPFEYRLAKNLACGTVLEFLQTVTAGAVTFTNRFTRTVGHTVITDRVTNSFASPNAPIALPDLTTTISTNAIALPDDQIIEDVNAWFRIDHTTVGDLELTLVHPDHSFVVLSSHNGGNNPNYGVGECGQGTPTRFDDSATFPVSSGTVPFAGVYIPDRPLARFNGRKAAGVWKLISEDIGPQDVGTLKCWAIELVTHREQLACSVYNLAPVAVSTNLDLPANQASGLQLTGSDPDGDPYTFAVVKQPRHGSISELNAAAGTANYTPAPGYVGSDEFSFQINDGYDLSPPGVVTIRVISSDTDGDSMPDDWENAHQLDPRNPADAAQDPDLDGASNLDEFRAGTDPQIAGSAFRISRATPNGGGIAIEFASVAGKSYQLQKTSDLAPPDWTNVGAVLAGTGNSVVAGDATPGGTTIYYRIILRP